MTEPGPQPGPERGPVAPADDPAGGPRYLPEEARGYASTVEGSGATNGGSAVARSPAHPPALDTRADRAAQLRAAGFVAGALVVVGVVVGVVWSLWSPPGPAGLVLSAGVQPDETEAWAAGDGRFAALVAAVGLVAGVAAWRLDRVRGPLMALALAVGGVGGALLADRVGSLVRGDGRMYSCGDGASRCVDHLPLHVQMHALWLVEAVLALLVYSLFTAFAVADDLGRPDTRSAGPHPDPATAAHPTLSGASAPSGGAVPSGGTGWPGGPAPSGSPVSSVGQQESLQGRGRYGDAAGRA